MAGLEPLFCGIDAGTSQVRALVFTADGCEGEPHETEEAIPIWTPLAQIPYDEMWADDRLWFPFLLEEKRFRGRFLFDGERMVTCDLVAGKD